MAREKGATSEGHLTKEELEHFMRVRGALPEELENLMPMLAATALVRNMASPTSEKSVKACADTLRFWRPKKGGKQSPAMDNLANKGKKL